MTLTRAARFGLLAAALSLSLTLTACNAVKFDPKAAGHVKTLAIEGPLEPPHYIVSMYNANTSSPAVDPYAYNYAQPGGALGWLLSGVIADSGDSEIDAAFTQKLTGAEKLRLGAELQSALVKALGGSGYDVTVMTPPSDAQDAATSETTTTGTGTTETDGGAKQADARLTVTFVYAGYVDQFFVPYEPLVWVSVALTDGKTGEDLFRQRYNYSTHTGNLDDVRFDPAQKFDFKKDADLLTDSTRAAEGLRAALPLIAADVATKLKRTGQ